MVSNMFYFHPYLGKWSNLTNSFHMGWNHQLDMDGYGVSSLTRPFSACLPTIHFSEAMLALGCVPPQNLTTRYPKWRHIWSPRYIFQPAYHFLGIYPLNFLGVAIHMCSWCFFNWTLLSQRWVNQTRLWFPTKDDDDDDYDGVDDDDDDNDD